MLGADADTGPTPAAPAVPISVGTAGWSYEDWKGIVYPAKTAARGFDPLGLMASLFDTNEINSTFYRIPAVRSTRDWSRRVSHNPRFAFAAKLYRGFTHERTAGSSEEKEFLAAMEPLAADGRLSAVLVQFPVSFHNTGENRAGLARVLDRFAALPLAVEFRHASWDRKDALDLLAEKNAAFVNIDQPWIGDNLRATEHVSLQSGRAYWRFHGRNAAKWFGPDTSNEQRYNYLYTEEQLAPFAGRIRDAAQRAAEGRSGAGARPGSGVSAILNNHFRGQAVANALQLQHLLTGEVQSAPPGLRRTYPALQAITSQEPGEGGLFDVGRE